MVTKRRNLKPARVERLEDARLRVEKAALRRTLATQKDITRLTKAIARARTTADRHLEALALTIINRIGGAQPKFDEVEHV